MFVLLPPGWTSLSLPLSIYLSLPVPPSLGCCLIIITMAAFVLMMMMMMPYSQRFDIMIMSTLIMMMR